MTGDDKSDAKPVLERFGGTCPMCQGDHSYLHLQQIDLQGQALHRGF